MSTIKITNLTFAYDGSHDNIYENASFQIDTDWKLGFIGRNGRGKTTLFRLMMNQYEYRGTILSPVPFDLFPYEVTDSSQLTADILYAHRPECESWMLERELSLIGTDPEILRRPFGTLSCGERTKAQLAVLFACENRFLLIDEPTNHLDTEARAAVARYLAGKRGFILISHDRTLLDGCVDHILSLNRSDIEIRQGNFSDWYRDKLQKDQNETERNAALKKEIARLTETAREKAAWSDKQEAAKIGSHTFDRGHAGHLAAKMMKHAKAIERRTEQHIEEKKTLLKNIEETESLQIHPLRFHTERLAEFSDIRIFYGEKTVLRGVSFAIRRGDRIALAGKNGCGKSSLLKLLCGEEIPFSGKLTKPAGLKISYVRQDTAGLSGSLTDYAKACGIDGVLFFAILRKLDFERVQFDKNIENYSEGQKKKVMLARSLCEEAHLYIWDEPLNYIDVFSRIQIEELLERFHPTMLFVEHDAAFREKLATETIFL